MPNWCENVLTISGLKNVLDEFIVVARLNKPKPCNLNNLDVCEEDEVLNFNSLYPIPSNIIDLADSYDWEVKNWGCKWGACESKIYENSDNEVEYEFLTPWAPPRNFLIKVSRDFPELKFRLEYEEPLMGFGGIIKFQNGKVIYEKFD